MLFPVYIKRLYHSLYTVQCMLLIYAKITVVKHNICQWWGKMSVSHKSQFTAYYKMKYGVSMIYDEMNDWMRDFFSNTAKFIQYHTCQWSWIVFWMVLLGAGCGPPRVRPQNSKITVSFVGSTASYKGEHLHACILLRGPIRGPIPTLEEKIKVSTSLDYWSSERNQ